MAYRGDSLTLVKDSQFPFIKRDLLANNPYDSPELINKLIEITKQEGRKHIVRLMIKHIIRFNPRATKKWDMPSSEKYAIIIFNKKIFKIKFKNTNRYTWAKIKIFGVSLLKIPVKKLTTTKQALKRLNITI